MAEAQVAFIGGSGLYEMEGLSGQRVVEASTPFGDPSDKIVLGTLNGVEVAFLPRHGRGHRVSPTEVPARANIYALKSLGVERVVSISAVGSLEEAARPLDLVVPDQIIDRTRGRPSTFFEDGIVAHVALADPFCPELSAALVSSAQTQPVGTHAGGTLVVIEGPQFSTRAESELYRSFGARIIGMTAMPEARLAREAEICYATLALVTDYDTWHQTEKPVSVEQIVANLLSSVAVSRQVVRGLLERVPAERGCACGSALREAIITSPDLIPRSARERLSAIVDKYLNAPVEVR